MHFDLTFCMVSLICLSRIQQKQITGTGNQITYKSGKVIAFYVSCDF